MRRVINIIDVVRLIAAASLLKYNCRNYSRIQQFANVIEKAELRPLLCSLMDQQFIIHHFLSLDPGHQYIRYLPQFLSPITYDLLPITHRL